MSIAVEFEATNYITTKRNLASPEATAVEWRFLDEAQAQSSKLQCNILMVQSFCEPRAWQAELPRCGLAPVKPPRYGALRMKRTVVTVRMTWGRHRRGSAPMSIKKLCLVSLRPMNMCPAPQRFLWTKKKGRGQKRNEKKGATAAAPMSGALAATAGIAPWALEQQQRKDEQPPPSS